MKRGSSDLPPREPRAVLPCDRCGIKDRETIAGPAISYRNKVNGTEYTRESRWCAYCWSALVTDALEKGGR